MKNATRADAAHLLRPKRLSIPRKVQSGDWTLAQLQNHLQWAADVELYTIPFYMTALYSIEDQACEAARLLNSVVNQEMFHLQCAANLANAFGADLELRAPHYGGSIPHLDFALNEVDPTKIFAPFSTDLGRFDVERLNAMAIIEFPDWHGSSSDGDEYGSIGELYAAIASGIEALCAEIQGGRNQADFFRHFYPDFAQPTIEASGAEGLPAALGLVEAITDQGEGQSRKKDFIPRKYQNQADDVQPSWDHFDKFTYLLKQPLPKAYELKPLTPEGRQAQAFLVDGFGQLLLLMNKLFAGEPTDCFGPVMFKIGAGIAACWQHGALPTFSKED